MAAPVNITGQRYGRLVALRPTSQRSNGSIIWVFRCDCGEEITNTPNVVRSGRANSCGCFRVDASTENNTTHGRYGSKEYIVWQNMKRRCFSKNSSSYRFYGGRGITICDRWRDSFDNFLSDMGESPSQDHQIDRVDGNGNYEPSNCRWLISSENRKLQRKAVWVLFRGRTVMLRDLCREYRVHISTAKYRINVSGMTVEQAMGVTELAGGKV